MLTLILAKQILNIHKLYMNKHGKNILQFVHSKII